MDEAEKKEIIEMFCRFCMPYVCVTWDKPPFDRLLDCKPLKSATERVQAICQLDSEECPECHGEGTMPKDQDDEERKERHIAYTSVTCPTCQGTGKAICQDEQVCPECDGEGWLNRLGYSGGCPICGNLNDPTIKGTGKAKPVIRVRRLAKEDLEPLLQQMIMEVPQLPRLWTWKDEDDLLQDNVKLSIVFNLLWEMHRWESRVIHQLNPDVEVVKE